MQKEPVKETNNDMSAEKEMNNSNTSLIAQARNFPKQFSKIFILKAASDMVGYSKVALNELVILGNTLRA